MTAVEPSPSTWTMRFKHGKQVVFLHVDPLTPFDAIKTELIKALRERHPDGNLEAGLPIPTDPAHILLAAPAEPADYSEGWIRLVASTPDDDEVDASKKGKKKKSAAAAGEWCPKTAGLADGAAVAFRFAQEDDESNLVPVEGESEPWDVVQPSYDDVNVMPTGEEEHEDDHTD